MMRPSFIVIIAMLAPAAAALAHEGHGHTDPHSPPHYTLEPVHTVSLMALVAVGVAVVLVVRGLIHRRSR